MPTVDIHELLKVLGSLATTAGTFGVPMAGVAGALAIAGEKLITDLTVATGSTREEIIAATNVQGAAVLLELAKDAAKGE